ncbi:hypothetical protein D9757_007699 [Collybiopsis confluens]|uniref:Inositol-pentakisphosphate 2-kinase n=1 Tax=Collybiopsis confluens TaxID=2823264 RepID=A0A8H5H619_9AGAR|nr:hypothetical protein D9757_007699 [Collybiopsis confluens]
MSFSLPSHWKYLSEGASTIVLTYNGPDSLFQTKILRIRKDDDSISNDELPLLLFQREIVPCLIPEQHLIHVEIISVAKSWLESLALLCADSRPTWRTDKIAVSRTEALLAPNLVASPITVEIKPKWSFLKGESPRTCRYCMHASTRGWATSYCPLDLFSSSPERIKRALYGLYDAWAAGASNQNNLRLFVGGQIVSSNTLSSALQNNGLCSPFLLEDAIRQKFVDTLHVSLLNVESSSLLHTLKRLQRTLDNPGIAALDILWKEIFPESSSFADGFHQPTLDEWYEFVKKYTEQNSPAAKTDAEKLQYHMLSYLLSATFKDCSIMIMLPGLLDKTLSLPASSYPSRIILVDLDQKPVGRFRKWLDQDREILDEYNEMVKKGQTERKICIDDWVR